MPNSRVVLISAALVLVIQTSAALNSGRDSFSPQAPASSATRAAALITVTVPSDDAQLVVEGKTIPGTGKTRHLETLPLAPGARQRQTFTTTWQPNTYTTMERSRTITVRPGQRLTLDLSVELPSDRVRVLFVPTPSDVVEEMVKLAGVTASDVVYEPGCGDARITIAAVKHGARKGVGIDIDPARVAESQTKVKEAGLQGKIEIRLGDALDIPDLSSATVVFLYMGDHFNLLIRPDLWKELKVGARIVSHRFTMGDWEPDKSVSVWSTDGVPYELHLWTVTEDIKRRMARR